MMSFTFTEDLLLAQLVVLFLIACICVVILIRLMNNTDHKPLVAVFGEKEYEITKFPYVFSVNISKPGNYRFEVKEQ